MREVPNIILPYTHMPETIDAAISADVHSQTHITWIIHGGVLWGDVNNAVEALVSWQECPDRSKFRWGESFIAPVHWWRFWRDVTDFKTFIGKWRILLTLCDGKINIDIGGTYVDAWKSNLQVIEIRFPGMTISSQVKFMRMCCVNCRINGFSSLTTEQVVNLTYKALSRTDQEEFLAIFREHCEDFERGILAHLETVPMNPWKEWEKPMESEITITKETTEKYIPTIHTPTISADEFLQRIADKSVSRQAKCIENELKCGWLPEDYRTALSERLEFISVRKMRN